MAMSVTSQAAMATRDADAESRARNAIEVLVDAFLADRRGNRACFTLAHRLGRMVAENYGCRLTYDADSKSFSNTCGVLALHSRIALSPGGPAFSVCSICGAEDFGCDHVPGRTYAGQPCFREITEWPLEEISLVRVPRDPRCYRVHTPITRKEAERVGGRALRPNEFLTCDHCQSCAGINGPADEDLDPASWPPLPNEE
jgi:hypothetical protein